MSSERQYLDPAQGNTKATKADRATGSRPVTLNHISSNTSSKTREEPDELSQVVDDNVRRVSLT